MMAVVVISPVPRKRRRTGSGVAMALATLGYGVATGYAKRRERKAKELAAQAEAEREAAKEAYTMGRQGEADERARRDQELQEKTFAMRETEFEQGQAARPQEAADAKAKREREEEDQRLQRQAAGFAAEDQAFDREKHERWRTEGPKPESLGDTEELRLKYRDDVFSIKTPIEELPYNLFNRLKAKLKKKNPDDEDVRDIIYGELAGVDKYGRHAAQGIPQNVLADPDVARSIEDYFMVENLDRLFEKKVRRNKWGMKVKDEDAEDEYTRLKREMSK
jgi:hypothetical protein